MTPVSLLATLLRERGGHEAPALPATLCVDDTHVVTFDEALPGQLTLECQIDTAVAASHPMLQASLLRWNRNPRIVGAGSFAVSDDGRTLFHRVTVPAAALDVDQLKTLVLDFVDRVARIGAALVADPFAVDGDLESDVAPGEPPTEMMAGMISA